MSLATRSIKPLAALIALALAGSAAAFESGSTGADGALNPTVNTMIQLPPNGVLNYTNINIPAGVTVTFQKNATNTPVILLVGGDATIAGIIDVSGSAAAPTGAAGNGSIGDDGNPGSGGPGGFGGGQGGRSDPNPANRISQAGAGPGAGGRSVVNSTEPCGGSGGGFGTAGQYGGWGHAGWCYTAGHSVPGDAYGEPTLLPVIGGSGGSGGAGGSILRGGGGGGGGGAIVLAASGTISVAGSIRANGGTGGATAGAGVGAPGGGGSGGAIRLIATTIAGNGAISANGGSAQQNSPHVYNNAGAGGAGRIRFEAESLTRTAASSPAHTFGPPGPVFVAGLPSLRVTRVAGIDAPAAPTGNADIALPEDVVNPIAVEVATTGVPLGNTVTITVTPAYGATSSYISNALSGTEDAATATASVTLPAGPSTLLATVSYSVPEAVAMQSPYRELSGADDLIETIAMQAMPDGTTRRIATTRSGREIDLSAVVSFGS